MDHFLTRKQTEEDFFFNYLKYKPRNFKKTNVKYGNINNTIYLEQLKKIKPKFIISFGSSILKNQMIKLFKNRMINVHLGISPKYRGAGTNFFPIINKEIQYLGVTYMFTNEVIDGGDIIHHETPNIYLNDNVHIIGNRIISKIPSTLSKLIKIPSLYKYKIQQKFSTNDRIYKKKDFNAKILEHYSKNYKQNINQFVKNPKLAKNLISII